jgi:hypothetical protein
MLSFWQKLAVLLAVPVVLAVAVGPLAAQSVVVAPPAVTCYSVPVQAYYAPPVVSYYAPPAVSYYAPPPVSYYAPPAVYAPATTVTTYRYGVLPRRQVTVTTYGAAPVVAPAPVVRYYRPVYVYP